MAFTCIEIEGPAWEQLMISLGAISVQRFNQHRYSGWAMLRGIRVHSGTGPCAGLVVYWLGTRSAHKNAGFYTADAAELVGTLQHASIEEFEHVLMGPTGFAPEYFAENHLFGRYNLNYIGTQRYFDRASVELALPHIMKRQVLYYINFYVKDGRGARQHAVGVDGRANRFYDPMYGFATFGDADGVARALTVTFKNIQDSKSVVDLWTNFTMFTTAA